MRKIIIGIFSTVCIYVNSQINSIENQTLINSVKSFDALNEGQKGVSIPLFSINVGNDTNLTYSLDYKSGGFKPSIPENISGIGWDFNFFGKIVREPQKDMTLTKNMGGNGIITFPSDPDDNKYDCIVPMKNINGSYSKKQLLLNPFSFNLPTKKSNFNPSKFYFDFFGYKGFFVFDNYGKPLVYCENARLEVEYHTNSIGQFSNCKYLFDVIDDSEFIIKDNIGNKFYFGGTFNELDINYTENYKQFEFNPPVQNLNGFVLGTKTNYITSWNLKKVETNTGLVITANYRIADKNLLKNYINEGEHYSNDHFNLNFQNFPSNDVLVNNNYYTNQWSVKYDPTPYSFSDYNSSSSRFVEKRAILDSIHITNGITVNFDYFLDSTKSIHLSNIKLKNGNKIIKNIILNQTKFGGNNGRYFLSSLSVNNEKYFFEYYKTNLTLPSVNDTNISYSFGVGNVFGYWSGDYDATLLKKIIYPTKAYSLYTYEQNDCSYSKNFDSYFSYNPFPNTTSNLGGARIKSIKSIDGLGLSNQEETTYTYKLDNGKSSGFAEFPVIANSLGLFLYDNFGKISYSQVQEKTIGKGYKEYTYSDFFTDPDSISLKSFGTLSGQDYTFKANNSYKRGRLLTAKIFDENNFLLKENLYNYSDFIQSENSLLDDSTSPDAKISDSNYYVLTKVGSSYTPDYPTGMYTMYVPIIPYLLKSEKIKEYINGNIIETTNEIIYRNKAKMWHPFATQISVISPKGIFKKKYLFPTDFNQCDGSMTCNDDNNIVGGQFNTYKTMVNSNFIKPVVEITKNENNKFSLQENVYAILNSSLFAPKKIRNSILSTTLDFDNYNVAVTNTINSIAFDIYDNKKNCIQNTLKNGVSVTTIYGYNQTLPIAKIEGATYEQVMQAFGMNGNDPQAYLSLDIVTKSNLDVDNNSELLLLNSLDAFRKKQELKDFNISTFTYNPLIGITSETLSSGTRKIYKYNESNKIEKIIDGNDKIVKEFKYNYANIFYNSEKNQSFTKNDCPSGYVGSDFDYVVPSGTHISIISQAHADQQALNDIAANGQNVANQNGTCFPKCPIELYNGLILSAYSYAYLNAYVSANQIVNVRAVFTGYSVSTSYWNSDRNIGKILGSCVPLSDREFTFDESPGGHFGTTPANRTWLVKISTTGRITVKLISGTIGNNSAVPMVFQFQFQK